MALIEFKGENDSFKINYIDAWQFELGECYIDNRNIVYLLDPKHYKFFKNTEQQLKNIGYENEQMEVTFSATMPHIFKQFKTINDEYCLVFKKPNNTYPLRNVLEYFDGEIDGKHVAWIITRLLNIVQFLTYNNLVHNGLSMDNIFINPDSHIVTIYGGWWYATEKNAKMIGTNSMVYKCLSPLTLVEKTSNPFTDLESVKLIGRQISGLEECGFTTLPESMITFLTSKSSVNPMDELNKWELAKKEAYGKPKFIEMPIDKNKIYNLKGDN